MPAPVRREREAPPTPPADTRRLDPQPAAAMLGIGEWADVASTDLYADAERFRPLIAAADPLAVELETAALITRRGAHAGAIDLVMGLVALAARHPEPHVASMVAAVGSFMPGLATSMALGELARRGVRHPPWLDNLGAVIPVRAWRHRDLFGDQYAVLVTFRYDLPTRHDAEHGLLVEVVTCPEPSILSVGVSTTVEELHSVLRSGADDERQIMEEITLEQAGAALTSTMGRVHSDAKPDGLVFLPILSRRVTRLPEPKPADPVPYTKQDRAAAVEAFLAATGALPGVDGDVMRFWARVLVGHTAHRGSARLAPSAPTRIGPVWLGHLLGEHVPRTFELTPAQRAGLGPVTTAWAAWAARQQGLPDIAVARLSERVAEIDQTFDAVYADPVLAATRCYLRDVTAVTADGEDLRRTFLMRSHAVPLPWRRSPATKSLIASDPVHRQRILADELESWSLAPDLSTRDWLDALTSVSEQLWHEDPPELASAVARYFDVEGPDGELLGDLTELAVDHAGDPPGYLAAALARVTPESDLGQF